MSKPPPRIVTLARTTSWKNEEVGSPKKRQRGGVKWDEDNLRVNEEIKAELDCQKIDEPDTPFVRSPQREEDDSDDEPPGAPSLEKDEKAWAKVKQLLEEHEVSESHAEPVVVPVRRRGAKFADDPPGKSTASAEAAELPSPSKNESLCFRSTELGGEWAAEDSFGPIAGKSRRMSNGEPFDLPSLSPSSSFEEGQKPMFEEKRRQHYDLKNALQMGKVLLEEEEEEDEELGRHL